MKNLKKILLFALAFFLLLTLVGCKKDNNEEENKDSKYTVTFVVEGTTVDTKEVSKNKRVTEPTEPTFTNTSSDEMKVFTGWYKEDTFTTKWNFSIDIVTGDMTLYAGYRIISNDINTVKMADEACTSKVQWTQAQLSDAYIVTIVNVKTSETKVLSGTATIDSANYLVTYTPDTIPQGGLYNVTVCDASNTDKAVTAENVMFGGEGTEANPYLIASSKDFEAVNKQNVNEGVIYQMYESISISTFRDDQKGYEFNGTLLGNGKTITITDGNCGAIYKLGTKGYIYNVNVGGTISTIKDSVGALVDYNNGKIEKVTSAASVESTAGSVGSKYIENALNESASDGTRGIAGCIVGTNEGTIVNCKVSSSSTTTGCIKAAIGGGLVCGYNKGTISQCSSNGIIGAANAKLNAKSVSKYSYCGGIAGINKGTISQCELTSGSKLLAQRYVDDSAVVEGTNNSNLGGIVGYNMTGATVTECMFSGVRVHGDENVGGIAGNNEGTITSCGVEGICSTINSNPLVTYIAGRINVGGVAGKNTGTVSKCFVTANVYQFTAGSTYYAVAEGATDSVALMANPNANTTDPYGLTNSTAGDSYAVEYNELEKIGLMIYSTGVVKVGLADNAGTADVTLAEDYLAMLGDKFYFNGTTIKLAYEQNAAKEETLKVNLYNGSSLWKETEVAESPSVVEGPTKLGYVFAGWALTADATEAKFASGVTISLYDLQDYAKDGVASLYAIFTEREKSDTLNVLLWMEYLTGGHATITADELAQLKAECETLLNGKITIAWTENTDSKVADMGAKVNAGNYDLVIGSGTNISTTGGVTGVIAKALISSTLGTLNTRQAALLSDSEYALELYAHLIGVTNDNVELTLVGDTTVVTTLNSLMANDATIPTTTAAEGKEFAGWALNADDTEAELDKDTTSIKYADVSSLATDGKVTLYAIYKDASTAPVTEDTTLNVAVWTKAGTWVTDAELEAIKTNFLKYLKSQGVDTDKVTITYTVISTETNKVADLGALTNSGSYDFLIGCGANVTTTGLVNVKEKMLVDVSYMAAGRYVARLTDNTLAVKMYAYFGLGDVVVE